MLNYKDRLNNNTRVWFITEPDEDDMKANVNAFCQGRLVQDLKHIAPNTVMITYLVPRVSAADYNTIIDDTI